MFACVPMTLRLCRSLTICLVLLGYLAVQVAGSGAAHCDTTPCFFVANVESIKFIDIANASAQGEVASGLTEARALALYVRERLVFWSEYGGTTEPSRIRCLNLTSMTVEDIISDVGDVEDIAVEWESGLIYWTDYMFERIEVADIKGINRKTLIWENVLNPRAIVLDPRYGRMYWSEWDWENPKIECATLAGTERRIIVADLLSSSQLLVNGMVIDYTTDRLYWIEAQTEKIEHVNFDGTNRTEVTTITILDMYPFSLTMYEDMLYFTDLYSRSIERLNLTTLEHERNMGWFGGSRVYGLALFDSSREPQGMTDCRDNANCSHLCLLTPSGAKCDCPNGYELHSDNTTCNAVAGPTEAPIQAIDIRLMNGSSPSDIGGRVEIRLRGSNEWGTICDDHFDMRDAHVICGMLNYEAADYWFSPSLHYGEVSDDVSILLDDLKCRGNEDTIMRCHHRGWNRSNCVHFEDVGVVCKNGSTPTVGPNVTSPTSGPPPNVTVKLRGGPNSHQGRVEIYHDGQWGTICARNFDFDAANVICRMLGHSGAWSTYCCGWFGSSSGEIWLNDVQCSGNESSIAECNHGGWGNHEDVCSHYWDVGVYCIPNLNEHPAGSIRLMEGTSPNEGRVEIYHDSEWGTICDDHWDLKDANVVCRMLNYSGALAAPQFSSYNAGSGKIWLDSLNCAGNESSLEDCEHGGWGNHDCSHSEDAGVICQTNDSALPVYDANNSLMFAETWRGIIYQVDLAAEPLRAAPLPIDSLAGVTAIGFDPVGKKLYYAEAYPGIIRRSNLDGSEAETIIYGIYYANRLAIDYLGGLIYFTDSARYRIDVAALDGRHRSALIDTPWPEGLALDLINGYIYWTSNGFIPRVERADMDGQNQVVLVNLDVDSHPSGMTLDYASNRLYWTDRSAIDVSYYDLNTNLTGTFISAGLRGPLDLTLHGNMLYATDVGSGEEWDGGIYSALLGGAGNVTKVIDLLKDAWGIDAYDNSSILPSDSSGCHSADASCSHLCLTSPQGPHCTCPDDMRLINETTCEYRTLILHTECYFSEIYKSPLGGDDLFSVTNTIPVEQVSCPSAIASDPNEEKFYWTDLYKKHIARANLDGTGEEIILQANYSLGLAVDNYAGNVYFTDKEKKTVEVAKLDGSFRKVLIQLQDHESVGLAIDLVRRYMYYSMSGNPPMIERAEMDGTNRMPIVVFPPWSSEGPSALAIDIDENILYWVGEQDPSVQYIDLRYPHSEIVYHIPFSNYLHHPLGLALDAYYFYWSDALLGNIIRASRNPGGGIDELIPYQYTPGGVNIYNPDVLQDPHSCVETCSHLCLLKPGGYKCACPDDRNISCTETTMVKNVDGCQEPSLYFIDRHQISCIDLTTSNYTYFNRKTVKTDIVQGAALDVDHREQMIYWSDISTWTINRMSLVSGETEIILRDLGEVEAIAVEWEGGLIYWTDYLFETIEVAKSDGRYRKTLIDTELYNPRGIAVDPANGYMFWTVWGFEDPKIERADLSGENRKTLVQRFFGFNFHLFIYGIVIDYHEERVYWIDEFNDEIASMDLDGSNQRHIHYISENVHPTDLALFGAKLCWSDEHSRSIHCINKTSPQVMHGYGYLSDDYVMSVVVADETRQPTASSMHRPPCRVGNGGCSHLCLLAPGGNRKCACPNGVSLEADGRTCGNVTQPTPTRPPYPDVQVRLVGSNSSNEGRVEVGLMSNGSIEWGTICDDHWGDREADVVCKMLNFSGAVSAKTRAYFGPGDKYTPILMDNVKCRGSEDSIGACRHNGWHINNCLHTEDAGVICRDDSAPPTEGPTFPPGPYPEIQVRLRSGPTSNQGRVEIFFNGTWGTVCDNNWGIEEANVICRMLNYTEGAWSTQCCGWYYIFSAPTQIWLDDVHCVGDETSIAGCRHGGWGSHNCGSSPVHFNDVGVVCKYTPVSAPDQTLRLADGLRTEEGRVEIFHAGHWGTVCDDFWDIKDAQVVCRQLGYSKALGAPRRAFFGQGNGHTWLDNVECTGNESSIENCPHRGWNIENCRHYEDASVICSNGSTNLGANDYLVFCESGRQLCYYAPLNPGLLVEEMPLMFMPNSPRGVTYDPSEKRLYWTNLLGNVQRAFLNSSSVEDVVKGLEAPVGIEIDRVGHNIFVADQSLGSIIVANLDGSFRATVLHHEAPQGIALDSEMGYIYFSSIGVEPQILRADMDGRNKIVLKNLSSSENTVIDLVLDKPTNRLFFSDQINEEIKYLNLGTMEEYPLLSGNLHMPTGLTLFNNSLYWTGWGDGRFTGAIFKAEAIYGSTPQMVAEGFSSPNGIVAHNSNGPEPPVQSACLNNRGCEHICVPTPNGDQCMCQDGMSIAGNGKDCILGDVLFVADLVHDVIYMAPLNGSSESTGTALPFENTENPIGVAFDPFERLIYWTEGSLGVVVRSDLSGKREEVIRSNVIGVMGIALDLVGKNAYWINNINNTIEVAKLNGDYLKVLVFDLHSSSVDITLDPTRGTMYWSAFGIIECAEMDGSNRRTIALLEYWFGGFYDAQGLVVDIQANRLYFTSRFRYGIFYIDISAGDGFVHELYYSFWYAGYPYGIAVDDEYVYWNDYFAEMVFRYKKDQSGDAEIVLSGLFDPKGLAVKKGNSTRDTQHPCFISNGGCSQLCLLKTEGGHTCACSSQPNPSNPCNETTVRPPITPYPTRPTSPTPSPSSEAQGCSSPPCIYFTDKTSIRAINHALANTSTKVDITLIVSNLLDARAIDVHVQENMIYWSDNEVKAIRRVNLTSGNIDDLVTDYLHRVEALAVEWESRLLYWTDSASGTIQVANLDGSFRKTLIYENLNDPRAIALDPTEGYMYFSDRDTSTPRLERAYLDGTHRQAISYYIYHRGINGLTIDYDEDRLYWLRENYIMASDLDGNNREYHTFFRHNVGPEDIDLMDDTLFFGDVNSHSIERINKSSEQYLSNFGWLSDNSIYGVAVFDSSRQPQGMKGCRQNNGGCSHLCLLTPHKPNCTCPDGMVSSQNGTNCTADSVTPTPRPPVQALEIRLRGGNHSNEGRVEIRKPDGSWGTICTDLWELEDARVACHMLRYQTALAAVTNGMFGKGQGPVWLDDVQCLGNEATLAECDSSGWGNAIFTCSSRGQAGVICGNESGTIPPPTVPSGQIPDVKVRLQNGPTSNQGRVEVFYNKEWRGICDMNWDINDADVVCKMLNFTGAWSTQCCGWYAGGTGKYWLNHVGCLGDEDTIATCRHAGWGGHGCSPNSDVGVICQYTPPTTPDGHHIRLVDGLQEGEGRVEIFFNGYWGTVCDDFWDIKDADVVCRMLNYSRAISAVMRAGYGSGNGHIWLDNVQCQGNESSIENCTHRGIGSHNCAHYEDAGVVCVTDREPNFCATNFMLYTDSDRGLILHQDLAMSNTMPNYLPVTEANHPGFLSYDQDRQEVYWSDQVYQGIYRSRLDGSSYQVVRSYVNGPAGLAVERITQTLYYVDTSNGVVEVSRLDGTFSKVIVATPSPVDIALDISNGRMYWISNNPPQIGCVEMNGANQIILANLSSESDPRGINLDVTNQRLVWTERGNKRIGYIDLEVNPSLPQTLIDDDQAPLQNLAGIFQDSSSLYWLDLGTGEWSGGVYKTDKQNTLSVTKISDALLNPVGIFVEDINIQITPVSTACQTNNGGCSHLCLLYSGGFQCACPSGMHLGDGNNATCEREDLIVFADAWRSQIYVTSLMAQDPVSSRQSLQVDIVNEPIAVAVDQVEGRCYWTDAGGYHIVRAYLDGTSEEIVAEDATRTLMLNGIAVDVVSRNLYWTSFSFDTYRGSVHVSRVDGSFQKKLLEVTNVEPFDIVLDPTRGYMYWATESIFGPEPHAIDRADMDGPNIRAIIELPYEDYWWGGVYGLALDIESNVLYWVGYHETVIQYVNLNLSISISGNLNAYIVNLFESLDHLWSPYGLTLYNGYVYWTDTYADIVARVNKTSGGEFKVMAEDLSRPRGIDVYYKLNQVNHSCNENNGGCTHLCLITPGGYQCACPTIQDPDRECLTTPTPSPPLTTPTTPTNTTTSPTTGSSTSASTTERPLCVPTTTNRPTSLPSSSSSTTNPPAPATAPTTPTTPTPTVIDHCASNPCENDGECSNQGQGFVCQCVGDYGLDDCSLFLPVVTILIEGITVEEFNETSFAIIVVEGLNDKCTGDQAAAPDYCLSGTESIVKRDINQGPFKPEDVVFPRKPVIGDDGKLKVEYAVVRTSSADGKPVVVPNEELAEITESKAADVGRKLGGTVLSVKANLPPTKAPINPTQQPQTGGKDSGMIAGIIVAVAIVILIGAAIAVWYFRVRKHSVPYTSDKEDTEDKHTRAASSRTCAFENPGYTTHPGESEADLPPVIFAPFEEVKEAGAVSNPVYADIGMENMSSGENAGLENEYDSIPASKLKHVSAGEKPMKVPLGEEAEVEIVVEKQEAVEKEPPYASLASTKDKHEEEKTDEPRYSNLASLGGTPSTRGGSGETVLVLDDNIGITEESKS